jgi:L-lactate dehydrogenase complex protein LldF
MGLGVWAFAAKRPALYRFAARLAARALKLLGGRGAVHALPLMNGWFAVRDLPTPQGRTFQDMWRNR